MQRLWFTKKYLAGVAAPASLLAQRAYGCNEIYHLELLMQKVNTKIEDRPVVAEALEKAEQTGEPAVALQLENGKIITGKTSDLLGSSAALLLNALKEPSSFNASSA